jgi:hypothetical protein
MSQSGKVANSQINKICHFLPSKLDARLANARAKLPLSVFDPMSAEWALAETGVFLALPLSHDCTDQGDAVAWPNAVA